MSVVQINAGLAELGAAFPKDHRAAGMLAFLARRHPSAVSRKELMTVGVFAEHLQGRWLAHASFEWWLLRLNDELRSHRWRVAEGEQSLHPFHQIDDTRPTYRLVRR
jgi:hypothetical protein